MQNDPRWKCKIWPKDVYVSSHFWLCVAVGVGDIKVIQPVIMATGHRKRTKGMWKPWGIQHSNLGWNQAAPWPRRSVPRSGFARQARIFMLDCLRTYSKFHFWTFFAQSNNEWQQWRGVWRDSCFPAPLFCLILKRGLKHLKPPSWPVGRSFWVLTMAVVRDGCRKGDLELRRLWLGLVTFWERWR